MIPVFFDSGIHEFFMKAYLLSHVELLNLNQGVLNILYT